MGADLMMATYVVKNPLPELSGEEKAEALRLAIAALPENVCQDLLETHSPMGNEDSEAEDPAEELFAIALRGLEDITATYHRYHTPIATNAEWSIWAAGGVSYGDDPYEGWSDLCLFLNVLYANRILAETLGYYANTDDFVVTSP